MEEQGESFDPDDEVAENAGRAWRFDGPWDWHPFDGAEPHEPAWPLTLLHRHTRANTTTTEEVSVTDATNPGSHQEECARWSGVARANPQSSGRPLVRPP